LHIKSRIAAQARIAAALVALTGSAATFAQTHPLDTLQPGHWYQVPNSRLDAVLPSPVPPGGTGPSAIMEAWSGGAYDTQRDRLIIWGGGHGDYAGNEIYVFDVRTLRWQRLTEPSRNVSGNESSCWYSDGLPKSRHTYDQLEYMPTVDRFIAVGCSSPYPQSHTYEDVVAFNFNTNTWSTLASSSATDYGALTATDPNTGHVWFHGAGSAGFLREYNPQTNVWTRRGASGTWIDYEMTASLDPIKRRFVVVGLRRFVVFNMDGGTSASPTEVSTSGPRTAQNFESPGFEWDPVIRKFVAWGSGASVYTIDLDSNTWTQVAPAATNTVTPTAPTVQGTFGRWRYMPTYNAYILVNEINQNVYFYKLSAGAGVVQPQVTLNASVTEVAPQGVATLTWSTAAADTCTASGGWSGSRSPAGGSAQVGPLSATTTFTLTCDNAAGGRSAASVEIRVVTGGGAPTVQLNATPAQIPAGAFASLDWTTSNATSCTASGGWSGSKSANGGTQNVGPLSANTTFTLTCNGSGGQSASDSANVTITAGTPPPAPTMTFSATPASIPSGQSSTLNWTSTNATSCTAGGAWSGNQQTSGTRSVGPLSTTSDYTLTCSGTGGSDTRTVTITVTAPQTDPPADDSSGGGRTDLAVLAFLALLAAASAVRGGGFSSRRR
jgi:hypothetical protein